MGPAGFIEVYANATGISMEAATEALNLRVVKDRSRAWNVSEEDAWKRLVKEDMKKKKKTKAPEWELSGEAKELLKAVALVLVTLIGGGILMAALSAAADGNFLPLILLSL